MKIKIKKLKLLFILPVIICLSIIVIFAVERPDVNLQQKKFLVFSVTITGPDFIPVDIVETYTANVSPVGTPGTYKWSIINGTDKALIWGSSTQQTVKVKGMANSDQDNDVTLEVVFTATGDPPTDIATMNITICKIFSTSDLILKDNVTPCTINTFPSSAYANIASNLSFILDNEKNEINVSDDVAVLIDSSVSPVDNIITIQANTGKYGNGELVTKYKGIEAKRELFTIYRNPTDDEWNEWTSVPPIGPGLIHLVRAETRVTAPATTTYNCIAYSIYNCHTWINPETTWANCTVFYGNATSYGGDANYELTNNPNDYAIILYGFSDPPSGTGPRHAAKKVGKHWESKLGGKLRIQHNPDQIYDGIYGDIRQYYKRK